MERPSSELVSARSAYAEASVSRAASFDQERLEQARRALDRAEGAHEAAPGTPEARALAYVAWRRAELAKVGGDYEFDRHIIAELDAKKRNGSGVEPSEPAAASPAEAAGPAGDSTASAGEELAAQRESAELATLVENLAGMEPLVTVENGSDQARITLDCAFVFVPKNAEIVASAHEKLDRVADALAKLGEERSLVVSGYTDSVGADAKNLELSKQRADALRAYLVSHGVRADRVRAEGRGEQAPVASNDTAEGRALNRRIEIVVAKPEGP